MRRRMDWMQNAILNIHQEQAERAGSPGLYGGPAAYNAPAGEAEAENALSVPLAGGLVDGDEYPETLSFPSVDNLPASQGEINALCDTYRTLLHCDFAVGRGCVRGDGETEMCSVDMFLNELEGRAGGANIPMRRRLVFRYKGALYRLVGYSVLTQAVISEVNSLLVEPGIHDVLLHVSQCEGSKDPPTSFFRTKLLPDPAICIMFAHVTVLAILVNGMMTQENYADPKTLRLKMLTLNRLKKELRHRVHKNISHTCTDRRYADL